MQMKMNSGQQPVRRTGVAPVSIFQAHGKVRETGATPVLRLLGTATHDVFLTTHLSVTRLPLVNWMRRRRHRSWPDSSRAIGIWPGFGKMAF
jgi:hypothetical protein